MRCLHCRTDNLAKDLRVCPVCNVSFDSLFGDILPSGTRLQGGVYEIEYALGRGGFGVTYRAKHLEFNRTVAIKEFFPQDYALRASGSGSFTIPKDKEEPYRLWLQRFKREGQILFDLNHPSIVRVQHLFSEYDTAYLVMELLEGHTLKDELRDTVGNPRKLKESRMVDVMNALVSALVQVHQRKLYHLDIKPDNVMLTRDAEGNERIVLIDFGAARQELARSVESAGKRSTVAYTEAYAPPELVLGAVQGAASDIFELGMMLHEMLTGGVPPTALRRSMGDDKTWQPSLSEPWQGMLVSALQLEPMQRPQDVAAWWGRHQNFYQRQAEQERQKPEAAAAEQAERERQAAEAQRQAEAKREAARKAEAAQREAEAKAAQAKLEAERRSHTRRVVRDEPAVPRRWLIFGGGGVLVALLWSALRTETQSPRSTESEGSSPTPTSPQPPSVGINLRRYSFEVVTVDEQGRIADRQQKSAEYFSENLGGVGLEMVFIPSGSFVMGSPESEEYHTSGEGPQHRVNIQRFYLGKYVVTQAQYEAVMGINPSSFKGLQRPVANVSWNDAKEFCEKLRRRTGKQYRLPSEAEWEYGCRGGTTTPFHYGETLSAELANYDGNYVYGKGTKGKNREATTEVGSFPANAYGLYDMHGNVWEWCEDAWYDNYKDAPTDGSVRVNNSTSFRLLRGGSWYSDPWNCRSAYRYRNYADLRFNLIGFRVALSSVPGSS
jgi:eukaryotic-like serine/threonine-protein kinase